MIVDNLSLFNFRNYDQANLELSSGTTVLLGSNGQGKTNLAESLVFLATLGSHRVATDAPLVKEGEEFAVIRAHLSHGERQVLLEVQINRTGSNKARINQSPAKMAELPRFAHVVLFAPEDLLIVRGEPAARRRFIDDLLIQLSPRMSSVLSDYDRVLKQRNALLKSVRSSAASRRLMDSASEESHTLGIWDEKLITLGTEIMQARSKTLTDLIDPVKSAYSAIAGVDHHPKLRWNYSVYNFAPSPDTQSSIDIENSRWEDSPPPSTEQFSRVLLGARSQEIDRGQTLVGPHRDDLDLVIRGLPVKGYASHGESWSMALALRLGSAEVLRTDSPAGDPVVILDDVFAELDTQRRSRLASLVSGFEQVLITAAVESDIPEGLHHRVVYIESGSILKEGTPGE